MKEGEEVEVGGVGRGEGREVERHRKREREQSRAGQGFIPADRGRDMTPIGEEAGYKGREREGGVEMGEEEEEEGGREGRSREGLGGAGGEGSINLLRNSFALGKV